jgi:hypothetical protein
MLKHKLTPKRKLRRAHKQSYTLNKQQRRRRRHAQPQSLLHAPCLS